MRGSPRAAEIELARFGSRLPEEPREMENWKLMLNFCLGNRRINFPLKEVLKCQIVFMKTMPLFFFLKKKTGLTFSILTIRENETYTKVEILNPWSLLSIFNNYQCLKPGFLI